ncbi:MAG: choice-of-anchor D domain-containing protein [Acidimicrobiales bacterium]
MSVKGKSFWSTTSGLVTGLAGTVTGIVGLVTVATQMGWIGSDDADTSPTGVTTEGSAAPGATTRSGAPAAATPSFTVDPLQVTFENLGPKKATVEVVNTGSAPMTVEQPSIDGDNPGQFSASAPTCTRRDVEPGRSCDVEVTFTPAKAGTPYSATLVIEVTGARPQEVDLSGSALL